MQKNAALGRQLGVVGISNIPACLFITKTKISMGILSAGLK